MGGVNAPPKKIRKLATKYSVVDKIKNNKLFVVNNFDMSDISTKKCKKVLDKLSIKSALICVDQKNKKFILSSRNIPNIKIVEHSHITAYDIVRYDNLITSVECMSAIEKNMI